MFLNPLIWKNLLKVSKNSYGKGNITWVFLNIESIHEYLISWVKKKKAPKVGGLQRKYVSFGSYFHSAVRLNVCELVRKK